MKPVRSVWKSFAPLLLGLCCVGIITLGACAPPRVNVQRALLSKLTTTGFLVNLDLSVFNPNTYELPLRAVQWKLNLFRNKFTQGSTRTNKRISSQATVPVRIPLAVRFSKIALGVNDVMNGRNIPWGIDGRCDFNTPIGPIFIQFNKKGVWANPIKGFVDADQIEHDIKIEPTTENIDIRIAAFEPLYLPYEQDAMIAQNDTNTP